MPDKKVLWTFVIIEILLTWLVVAAVLGRMRLLPVLITFAILSGINSVIFVIRAKTNLSK